MDIKPFLEFNSHCPLCNKPLSLFLEFIDRKERFKAIVDKNRITFNTIRGYKQYYFNISNGIITSNFKPDSRFNLVFLCNTDSIINEDINPNTSCYYRSSPTMKINNYVISKESANINNYEYFILSKKINDIDHFYILSRDFEENKSSLYHYKENEDVVLFDESLPQIVPFESKEQLFKIFKQWMSFI